MAFINSIKKIIPDETKTGLRKIQRYLLSYKYFGFKYHCPFCRGSFCEFLIWGRDNEIARNLVGAGSRPVMCPRCYSTDRERLMLYFLKRYPPFKLQNSTPIKLLHVSPEMNLEKELKKLPQVEYLGAELNPNKGMVQMDITDIRYPDGSFDAIICNHVLEHIQDDQKAMSELFRVLTPEGFAILQVPYSRILKKNYEDFSITDPADREKAFGQKDHVRIYAKEEYIERLEAAGFQVNQIKVSEEMNSDEFERFGLNREEILFLCLKPLQE